jgi:NAD(P)-dependent dehydrogenase (short-subunit alcohol dehydrogenase family)
MEINSAFARFKELADRKSEIFDEDILALVSDESVTSEKEQYGFVSLSQRSETGETPFASIVFTAAGKEVRSQAQGNGPVDASLKAIEAQVQSGAEMVLYSVNAISGSTESQGEVTVRLQNSGRVVNGVGSDPDIVVASAKAYLNAYVKTVGRAVAKDGVILNAVMPGAVSFEGSYWDEIMKTNPIKVNDFLSHHQAVNRFGKPKEIASVVTFLVSDLASFMHGSIVPVDGGNM